MSGGANIDTAGAGASQSSCPSAASAARDGGRARSAPQSKLMPVRCARVFGPAVSTAAKTSASGRIALCVAYFLTFLTSLAGTDARVLRCYGTQQSINSGSAGCITEIMTGIMRID